MLSTSTKSLHEVLDEVQERVSAVVKRGESDFSDLDEMEDCAYIKNSDFVLVYSNNIYRRLFAPDNLPIGRTGRAMLEKRIAEVSVKTDELVIQGCSYVECEHLGRAPDGSAYRFLTLKRSLKDLGEPGLAIVGVTRVLEELEESSERSDLEYGEVFKKFLQLDERDREICRLTALGASSRELAEQFAMTTRGIELRKQKALASLGVSKAVELVRLLVRLQDKGFLDLGL